jgi:phosphatidate cytidylyltransferase
MDFTAFQITCILTISLLLSGSIVITLLRFLKPQNETFQKVATIIRSWWFIAGFFLLALSWYRWGILIFIGVLSFFAIREYLKVSQVPYKSYLIFALSILCVLQYAALAIGSTALFLSMIPVLCLWIIPGLVIYQAAIENIELVTAVGFGLSLMIYYTSYIPALSALPQLHLTQSEGTFATLLLILLTWCNDIFQFLAGKTFGRRKIIPEVSPNKTLAGFIGGIIGTMGLASLCFPRLLHLSVLSSLILGVIMGVTGMFGDLFFSAIKRKIGVKDFSQALPGHGGLLDRLDSLIFTAPIYFHYLLFIKS